MPQTIARYAGGLAIAAYIFLTVVHAVEYLFLHQAQIIGLISTVSLVDLFYNYMALRFTRKYLRFCRRKLRR